MRLQENTKAVLEDIKDIMTLHSYMSVGHALKEAGIKYESSFEPIPNYTIKINGSTWAICNERYAEAEDYKINGMALGELA
jgi:hypothetical protein